jgi:hypothetical protein
MYVLWLNRELNYTNHISHTSTPIYTTQLFNLFTVKHHKTVGVCLCSAAVSNKGQANPPGFGLAHGENNSSSKKKKKTRQLLVCSTFCATQNHRQFEL